MKAKSNIIKISEDKSNTITSEISIKKEEINKNEGKLDAIKTIENDKN